MKSFFPTLLAGALVLPLVGHAQLPSSELHSIYPPVIVAGQTTEITLTGVNLDEPSALHFSNPKITAKPVLLSATEFRKKPVPNGTRFQVTVPAEMTAGTVEIRAAGYFGLSTSRPLVIVESGKTLVADSAGGAHHAIETAPELARDVLAYGRVDGNQTDWWKVSVKKGDRLLIHCQAERIDSQTDATLKLVDGRGYELETSRDAVGRDPMIDFTAPADGNYWVGVHDFLYSGGTNFAYLLEVSQRPWIDAAFPPAGQPGQVIEATLFGRNLPGGSQGEGITLDGKPIETLNVKITVPKSPPAPAFDWDNPARALLPTFAFQHANSNPVEIGFANNKVVAAPSDTDIPPVTPPCEIAARFDEDGDTDAFHFLTKKGTTYWVEVIGDRIAGHMDPYLVVEKVTKQEDGTETFAKVRDSDDDNGRGGATFYDGTRDTSLSFGADQDGEYRVTVVNQFATGGINQTYRLAIREAQPDFEVLAVTERPYIDARQAYPAAPLLRKGGTFPLRLLVKRSDGFTGPITVQAEGLPPGVTCPSVTVADKETTVRLVLAAAPDAKPWDGTFVLHASGKVGDAAKKHPVRSGSVVLGIADTNTARLRSRLNLGIPLSVREEEVTPARIEVDKGGKFSVAMGEKLEIPVKVVSSHEIKGNLAVTPVGLRGLTKPPVINIAEKAKDGKLTLNFTAQKNVFAPEVGTWNFVLKGTGVTKYKRNPKAAERAAAEQKHIEALAKQYADAATKAKADVAAKKKANDQAQQNLKTASTEAKPQLEKAARDAKTAFDKATADAAAVEAKRAQAEKEKAAAVARATAATKAAAQKDVKFATWSLPITVEVKPAPEKK